MTDTRSPGGWLRLESSSIARKLYLGTAASAVGAFLLYGAFQGKGADHFVEVDLSPVAAADTVITSVANPLQESMSGVVLADLDSYICFEETPSPASTLDVGVSDADGEGDNDALYDGLSPKADECYTLFGSGAIDLPHRVVVNPNDYTGSASYITFRWKTGSGQTVSGNAAGFARIKVSPCTDTVGCD